MRQKKLNKNRRIGVIDFSLKKAFAEYRIDKNFREKYSKMLFILFAIGCTLISHVTCAPKPQQEAEFQPAFDIESLAQRIPFPQGFSAPNRDSRQANDPNIPFGVVRYFFELNDLSYRFT